MRGSGPGAAWSFADPVLSRPVLKQHPVRSLDAESVRSQHGGARSQPQGLVSGPRAACDSDEEEDARSLLTAHQGVTPPRAPQVLGSQVETPMEVKLWRLVHNQPQTYIPTLLQERVEEDNWVPGAQGREPPLVLSKGNATRSRDPLALAIASGGWRSGLQIFPDFVPSQALIDGTKLFALTSHVLMLPSKEAKRRYLTVPACYEGKLLLLAIQPTSPARTQPSRGRSR